MSGIEPVRKQIIVNAPQARAFAVFTADIDRWWPRELPQERGTARLRLRARYRWMKLTSSIQKSNGVSFVKVEN